MAHFIARHLVAGFGTEILYAFLIIVCSLMIYFATKELYELTGHKGIKYFRLAFFYFAIAYFFRSFIKFILVYFDLRQIIHLNAKSLAVITIFLFAYFSTMAIFYLLYSGLCKKWKSRSKKIFLFHVLAIVIALIIVTVNNIFVYFAINLTILILVILIITLNRSKTKRKKKHGLYPIYILLFIFWILNILDILIPSFLQTFQLLIYLASTGIFLTILYKVIKRCGSN